VGLPPERLRAIRLAASSPLSLDAPVAEDPSLTRADLVVDETALDSLESVAEHAWLANRVADAMNSLPSREREVLELRYGLGNDHAWTLGEIGHHLGVTRELARQLEGQALRRLKGDGRLRRELLELVGA
jgi:RNA polymerase primary sigma factor